MPLQQWLLQSSGSNSVRWLFSFSVLYLYYYYFLFSVSVLEDGFRVNGTDSLCSCPRNHFLIIETCLPCGCAKKHVCEEESGVCPIKRCKRGRYGISVGCVFGRCLLLEKFESDTYLLPPGSVLFYYSFQFGLLYNQWPSQHVFMYLNQRCSLIELFYDQLRIIFWKIKFKIIFQIKLTLFLIFKFVLYLSLLTLRTHDHCCSTQCGMKPMNMLSKSESAVKARKLILSCQILIMTKSSAMWCHLTYNEKNFKIELLQYWKACSCAILLLCGSVVHHCWLL